MPRRKIMRPIVVLIGCQFFLLMSSCVSGNIKYTPPIGSFPEIKSTIVVEKSKDTLWKQLIPALGSAFFVINNLDKDSGFINVSYSGDPQKYVDCGFLHTDVTNLRGRRDYDFPSSKAKMTYELIDPKSGNFFRMDRKMTLEGRINIIVQEIAKDKTQLSVNIKFVVTKSVIATRVDGINASDSETITFNSGQRASFEKSSGTENFCVSTGKLEEEIINLLSKQ